MFQAPALVAQNLALASPPSFAPALEVNEMVVISACNYSALVSVAERHLRLLRQDIVQRMDLQYRIWERDIKHECCFCSRS